MTFTEKYHDLLNTILQKGVWRDDPNRQGHKRKQIPFADITHDLREGFPAITTKPLYWRGVVVELLWFLKGDTNIKYLLDNNVHIWDKDAYNWSELRLANLPAHYDVWLKEAKKSGVNLGRIYGAQWRSFGGHPYWLVGKETDQISNLINTLRTNPLSSGMIVNSWNPAELNDMALPPCHYSFQVSCEKIYKSEAYCDPNKCIMDEGCEHCVGYDKETHFLDLQFNMRSSDVMLGLPFNMASYALLASILAKMCNIIPRYVRYNGQNVHLYDNQIEAAKEQLSRTNVKEFPKRFYDEPTLVFSVGDIVKSPDECETIDEFLGNTIEGYYGNPEKIKLINYKHHPVLKNQPEMLSYN
jgi:thymidylate synthase